MTTACIKKDRSLKDMLTKPSGGSVGDRPPPGNEEAPTDGEEVVSQRVRDNPNITGVKFGGDDHTISQYADEVIVALDNSLSALPVFFTEVDTFGAAAGFLINFWKSQTLNLIVPPGAEVQLSNQYPIEWAEISIPYLGIQLALTVAATATLNYRTFLQRVTKDLEPRCLYHLS
ncbi:hypothetical protein NDU88_002088 [Pleurodeles waltl]|uniref:Uncharacterized protein n=1 Tax=Pleurodeles waltl TaxID=8319 RepID=A0AAV7MNK8_PLEWA|nr:hypothetical protein NDU88_002088 [Pleurodeles waltl]